MIRAGIMIAAGLALAVAAALAQPLLPMPMVPYTQPSGPMSGLGGPMMTNSVAGGGSTPCSGNAFLVQVGVRLLANAGSTLCVQ